MTARVVPAQGRRSDLRKLNSERDLRRLGANGRESPPTFVSTQYYARSVRCGHGTVSLQRRSLAAQKGVSAVRLGSELVRLSSGGVGGAIRFHGSINDSAWERRAYSTQSPRTSGRTDFGFRGPPCAAPLRSASVYRNRRTVDAPSTHQARSKAQRRGKRRSKGEAKSKSAAQTKHRTVDLLPSTLPSRPWRPCVRIRSWALLLSTLGMPHQNVRTRIVALANPFFGPLRSPQELTCDPPRDGLDGRGTGTARGCCCVAIGLPAWVFYPPRNRETQRCAGWGGACLHPCFPGHVSLQEGARKANPQASRTEIMVEGESMGPLK